MSRTKPVHFVTDDMTRFYGYVKNGHVKQVKLLINEGRIDLNQQGPTGFTVLHTAVYHGLTDMTLVLLNNGANVHVTNYLGETVYESACAKGSNASNFLREHLRKQTVMNVIKPLILCETTALSSNAFAVFGH